MKRGIPPTARQLELSRMAFAPHGHFQKAIIEGVDVIAAAMERKWGIDRLRLLVGDDLRIRFDAQAEKFNAAIETGQSDLLRVQAEGMKRAWQTLDREAAQAGHKPLSPEVWEVTLPQSGKSVAIVRTSAEAHLVATPERETWTLSDIANLIENKSAAPAASSFDWRKGDDIPF